MSVLTAPRTPGVRVPDRPRWTRRLPAGVLLLSAFLYAWGLWRSGDANAYYSAAVKSGAMSWKAFFFGSLDSASFITVDKPPMALWVQEIAARLFGFSTWSLLLPEVIMGVVTIGVLYATVRRAYGPVAGLVAALVLALTPITVAIDHDNNPDTLLVLLLVLAAWACQRATESGRLRWLMASAFFLGCGFNTKMLQAYLLLPALFLVYLLCARGGLFRRVWHLAAAGVVLAVASFWWMVVVDLIPAGSRPYIGGSTDNTVWDLVIGYNGLGRVFGGSGGGPRAGQGASFAGAAGWGRLFNDVVGAQISWLLPFAAIALVAVAVMTWKRPRTDLPRATLVLWGGWLAVHFTVFSLADGTMHPYYTTALAPAIAALTGIGAVVLFDAYHRADRWSWVLVVGIAATGTWSFLLLRRTPDWHPWLSWTVAAVTAGTVIAAAAPLTGAVRGRTRSKGTPPSPSPTPSPAPPTLPVPSPPSPTPTPSSPVPPSPSSTPSSPVPSSPSLTPSSPVPPPPTPTPTPTPSSPVSSPSSPSGSPTADVATRPGGRKPVPTRTAIVVAIAGLLATLAGPAAYAASAATSRTNGTNPLAGPSAGGFSMGGPGGRTGAGMPGGGMPPATARELMREGRFPGGPPPTGGTTGSQNAGRPNGSGSANAPNGSSGSGGSNGPGGAGGTLRGGPPGGGGPGMGEVSSQLTTYLKAHRDGATWLVAVTNAQSASSIILRTGLPVIAMGGFTGSDPAMTVTKLQGYVRAGKLHYVLTGGGGPGGGGNSSVTSWVAKNCSTVKTSEYSSGSTTTQNAQALYFCG